VGKNTQCETLLQAPKSSQEPTERILIFIFLLRIFSFFLTVGRGTLLCEVVILSHGLLLPFVHTNIHDHRFPTTTGRIAAPL
jgi:hypothetical protein